MTHKTRQQCHKLCGDDNATTEDQKDRRVLLPLPSVQCRDSEGKKCSRLLTQDCIQLPNKQLNGGEPQSEVYMVNKSLTYVSVALILPTAYKLY